MLSFGLTNAPATFQAVMNRVFKDVIGKFVMVYLDDILILRSPEEHRAHLRQVLQILQDNQLYAKLSKCSFGQSSVAFLGHTLSADGLSVDLSKVSAVHRPYATADNRTDSMIIGIGAAHAGAPVVYYMGGVRQSVSQSSRDTRPETHQQY